MRCIHVGAVAGTLILGWSLAPTASAQAVADVTARSVEFALTGGVSQPVGSFGDVAYAGMQLGTGLWLRPFANKRITLRTELDFQRYGGRRNDLARQYGVGFSQYSFGGSLSAQYQLARTFGGVARPYVLGGLGAYHLKYVTTQNGESLESPGRSYLGLHGGLGLDFRPNDRLKPFLEVRVQQLFVQRRISGQQSFSVPLVLGIRF